MSRTPVLKFESPGAVPIALAALMLLALFAVILIPNEYLENIFGFAESKPWNRTAFKWLIFANLISFAAILFQIFSLFDDYADLTSLCGKIAEGNKKIRAYARGAYFVSVLAVMGVFALLLLFLYTVYTEKEITAGTLTLVSVLTGQVYIVIMTFVDFLGTKVSIGLSSLPIQEQDDAYFDLIECEKKWSNVERLLKYVDSPVLLTLALMALYQFDNLQREHSVEFIAGFTSGAVAIQVIVANLATVFVFSFQPSVNKQTIAKRGHYE